MLLGSETGPIHNFYSVKAFLLSIHHLFLKMPTTRLKFLDSYWVLSFPSFRLCNIIAVLTTCRMVDFLLVVVLDLIFKPETILYSLLLMQRLHDRIERGKTLPESSQNTE